MLKISSDASSHGLGRKVDRKAIVIFRSIYLGVEYQYINSQSCHLSLTLKSLYNSAVQGTPCFVASIRSVEAKTKVFITYEL